MYGNKGLTILNKPTSIMVVGVNGTGKTTTAAKLAKFYKDRNKEVLMIFIANIALSTTLL